MLIITTRYIHTAISLQYDVITVATLHTAVALRMQSFNLTMMSLIMVLNDNSELGESDKFKI